MRAKVETAQMLTFWTCYFSYILIICQVCHFWILIVLFHSNILHHFDTKKRNNCHVYHTNSCLPVQLKKNKVCTNRDTLGISQSNPKINHPLNLFPSTDDKNNIHKTTNYDTNAKQNSSYFLKYNQIRDKEIRINNNQVGTLKLWVWYKVG